VGSPELQCDGCVTEVHNKIKDGKNKNEHTKETMGVKGKPDIIDIIEKKKRMSKKNVDGRSTTAMTARNLEPDRWRNREEWHLVSGRWRQLL
jgi:hypothetical protein